MNRDECVDCIGRRRYPGDLYNIRNVPSVSLRITLGPGRTILHTGMISHIGSGGKYYSGTYIYFSQVEQ